jgi:hypothetical protein
MPTSSTSNSANVMAAGGLGNMDWSLVAFLAGMSCYLVLGALTLFFTIARLRRQGRLSKASRHTRDRLIIRSLLILTVAASFFGSAPSVEAGPARHLSSLKSEPEQSTIYPADITLFQASSDNHNISLSPLEIAVFSICAMSCLGLLALIFLALRDLRRSIRNRKQNAPDAD